MNEDDRRGPESSKENIQEDKADISSDISDDFSKRPVIVALPKLPEDPKNINKGKKVCVRK